MSVATAPAGVAADRPDPAAADQEVLARALAETVRRRLAGDGPEMARISQQRPSQVLQLGVLPPLPAPDPDRGLSSEELAREYNMPPNSIGLTFHARPEGDELTFELESDFLFYVQRYPTRAEQLDHQGDAEEEGGNVNLFGVWEAHRMGTDERLTVTIDLAATPHGRETLSLDDLIRSVLDPVYRERETVYPFGAGAMRLPRTAAEGSDEEYWQVIAEADHEARADKLWDSPSAAVEVAWRRLDDSTVRVTCTLVNQTVAPARVRRKKGDPPVLYRDLHLFNCHLRVFERFGTFEAMRFRDMPSGFRYDDLRFMDASGQNCVGRRMHPDEHPERPLTTETWPLYRQSRMEPNDDPQLQMTFAELAGDGVLNALGRISVGMDAFADQWRAIIAHWPTEATRGQVTEALGEFLDRDVAGFKRGLRCLRTDARLLRAYRAANQAFEDLDATRSKRFFAWRLFQVVYQVMHLPALAARERPADHDLRAELDIVDVLWFPTGGGKTEAYLGLIATAMFYDRLRGKSRGVTAILRFPLRMLSVQQLERIQSVLWFCERIRTAAANSGEIVDGGTFEGDAFLLGYWAGRSNTPNSLTDRRKKAEGDHIEYWIDLVRTSPKEADERRILTVCPNPACNGGKIVLRPDKATVRLHHHCETCGEDLPVVVTDDEVYRYLPAVLICTVDKVAHIARAEQFIGVLDGPLYRCPKHNYFNQHVPWWKPGNRQGPPAADDRCIAGELCTVPAEEYVTLDATHDPPPALTIQDELHLLEEELGTFDAHYESTLEHMTVVLGHLPTKQLAATATIEAVDDQVQQVYARVGRVFPTLGWKLGHSFYVRTTGDARRLYFGALPYRTDPAEFGERVQAVLHERIIAMRKDPADALADLQAVGLSGGRDAAWLTGELDHYDLSLGYVNQKRDAERVSNELSRRRFGDPPRQLNVDVLVGDATTLAHIAEVLGRIGEQYTNGTAWEDRLHAMVATSIVSHGVDLDALNLMVMNGMTPTVAGYVQASSRAGRSHVGLVIVGYDRRKVRERSFYQYFLKYHEFLDRLISPVPVNRFAKFAAKRTVPGVMSALLLQVCARQRLRKLGPDAKKVRRPLSYAPELRAWFGGADAPTREQLRDMVRAAVGLGKTVHLHDGSTRPLFDPVWESGLREQVDRHYGTQMTLLLAQGGESSVAQRFEPKVLSSFRDVDDPMEFSPMGAVANIELRLTNPYSR